MSKKFLTCVWALGLACAGYGADGLGIDQAYLDVVAGSMRTNLGALWELAGNERLLKPQLEGLMRRVDEDGMNLLMYSAKYGGGAVFAHLLNVNDAMSEEDRTDILTRKNQAGENLFMLSVKSEGNFSILLDYVRKSGAPKEDLLNALRARDSAGNTLLMHAILGQTQAGLRQITSTIYRLSPSRCLDLIKAVNAQGMNVFMCAAKGCADWPDGGRDAVWKSIRLLFSYVRWEERRGVLEYRAKGCSWSTLEYLARCFFPKQIIYDSADPGPMDCAAVFEIKTEEDLKEELLGLPEAEGGLFRKRLRAVLEDALAQMA